MKFLFLIIYIIGTGLSQKTGGSFYGATNHSDNSCVDNKGQHIPENLLYTPGEDECQVCRCVKQMPVLCRTFFCAPPTNCLRLRVGSACCQWICDDWDKPGSLSDIGLRLVASCVTAILSLSLLFFLVYRLRQRRIRSRQNHFQAESFNSELGSVDRQLTQMGWRKSLGQFSRPFPPSYDEAVMNSNLTETIQYQVPAPTYFTSHHSTPQYPDDPVIPYQVATLGRQVLPPVPDSNTTAPSTLRSIRNITHNHQPAQQSSDEQSSHNVDTTYSENVSCEKNCCRHDIKSLATSRLCDNTVASSDAIRVESPEADTYNQPVSLPLVNDCEKEES